MLRPKGALAPQVALDSWGWGVATSRVAVGSPSLGKPTVKLRKVPCYPFVHRFTKGPQSASFSVNHSVNYHNKTGENFLRKHCFGLSDEGLSEKG